MMDLRSAIRSLLEQHRKFGNIQLEVRNGAGDMDTAETIQVMFTQDPRTGRRTPTCVQIDVDN